ncbi:unnamed protein product [Oppiella nova]|uniref:C2H2-type domain-containing protein n=1 Tax=Oppiella nova TaxID=334625 RepID=A0A7R9M452_9ACAR|nr:unnamed protein product [Oppiella nova]CAG2170427.1 unnamed protein product [Oppiella nova]
MKTKTNETIAKRLRNEIKGLKGLLKWKQKLINSLRQKTKRLAQRCKCGPNEDQRKRLIEFCDRMDSSAKELTESEIRLIVSERRAVKTQQFLLKNSGTVERVDKNTYLCLKCDKSFGFLSQLRRHLISHSDDKNRFECQKCHKRFKWREGLNKHVMYSHDNLRPNKTVHCMASECDKRFRHVFEMNEHFRQKHSRCPRYRCQYTDCADSEGFVSKQEWERHVQLEHMNAQPLHRCQLCHKDFKCESNLIKHQNVKHLRIESFECNECEQRFVTKPKLSLHEFNAHNKAKTYRCEWPACEFSTVYHKSMNRHKLIHTNTRPFKCDWTQLDSEGQPVGQPCGAAFKQINTLKI